jgi:hypothetical protein
VNSPPPKPEVILTNFFAEPTVLLVPITSHDIVIIRITDVISHTKLSVSARTDNSAWDIVTDVLR